MRRAWIALILAMAAAWMAAAPAVAAGRIALVIGNGAYRKVPVLPNPTNDAADVAAALGRLGFAVKQLANVGYDDMRRGLLDFGRQAREADMAVVFFAGHGMEIAGENWLIPVDAELNSDRDAENEAISLRNVMAQVAQAKQLGLVMLDACRNNLFAAKMQRSSNVRAVERGFARTEPAGNVLVAYAAKDGTTASDGTGRNSPFTAALLNNLETPGLEVRFLFASVHDEVLAATRKQQEPFVYGALSRQAIYLAAPPADNKSGGGVDAAALAWAEVKTSNDPAVLRAFLRRFGDSIYADLARIRLGELTKPPPVPAALPPQRIAAGPADGATVQFGGPPYCRYSVTLKGAKIAATIDPSGDIPAATLTLTMVEGAVGACPHATLGVKPHVYSGTGRKTGDHVALQFFPDQANAPKAMASFAGQLINGRLVGTLSVNRSDQTGNLAWKAASQFK